MISFLLFHRPLRLVDLVLCSKIFDMVSNFHIMNISVDRNGHLVAETQLITCLQIQFIEMVSHIRKVRLVSINLIFVLRQADARMHELRQSLQGEVFDVKTQS